MKGKVMDALEQMALDLENAQQARFRKAKDEDLFWANKEELTIFETIKTMRQSSRSYEKPTKSK